MDALSILDSEYGEDRDVDYVLVIESKDDLKSLKDINIYVRTTIPEYTDRIKCNDGQVLTSILVLLSDDFAIVVIMPLTFLIYTNWAIYLYANGIN